MDWHSLEPALNHQDNDKRTAALHQLKNDLEHAHELVDPDLLASTLKLSLKSNNAHVSFAALASLPPLFSLLVPADYDAPPSSPSASSLAHTLRHSFAALLPSIAEKLGDAKLPTRETAREALVSAARASLRLGINAGVGTGKDKEGPWGYLERTALHFLLAIRAPSSPSSTPLPPLRPFTPLLLPLLSDSDPSVRSVALTATITIFTAPSVAPAARADLKKAMLKFDVAKKVQDQILSAVLGSGGGGGVAIERSPSQGSTSSLGGRSDSSRGASASSRPASSPPPGGPATRTRTRAQLAQTQPPSLLSSLPAAAFPSDPSAVHSPSSSDISPVYLASERDLREQVERMKPCFAGKETEHNWMERDRSVATLRGMLLGGVAKGELVETFVRAVKEVQDGILKTCSSLRTTLAISALTLISELSTSLPSSQLDVVLDPFLTHTLSMAGQTKKITASASQATVTSLLTHSSYHRRTAQLLLAGMGEKIVSARQFVSSHLLTFLNVHASRSKSAMDSTGGTDDLEAAITKALTDANAQVRENARRAYWEFVKTWPGARAERITAGLDANGRKLLEKSRPQDAPEGFAGEEGAVKPSGNSSSSTVGVPGAKKPSVREIMLAAKRKAAAERAAEASGSTGVSSPEGAGLGSSVGSASAAETARSPLALGRSTRPGLVSSHSTPSKSPAHRLSMASPDLAPSPSNGASPAHPSHAGEDPEPVVDDALKEQAMQAEQAAERLLEIAQDEDDGDEVDRPASPSDRLDRSTTPKAGEKVRTAPTIAMRVGAMHTPLVAGRRFGANDVFEDSPDVKDGMGAGAGKGRGNWWMHKSENQPPAPPLAPDSPTRTTEINALIASLASLSIEPTSLRKLSALSKERPVREADDEDGLMGGGEPGTPSRSVANGNGKASGREDAATAARWWSEGRRFSTVYEGLRALLLQPETTGSSKDMALILLKDLVENQFPCFVGDEAGVFSLLLQLREDPSRTSIAATEAIATSFAARLEPLYGLGSLSPALSSYLAASRAPSDAIARSFALGLRLVGTFFEALPVEVLEDVLPQTKELLKRALNDPHSGDLRRAAINALVSAQSVLRDEQRLVDMLEGFTKDQANLLSYYCAKRGV
ncbi:SPOSA6832_01208 [Sporobolomyces salmonicolor]|uniref:SPOSA6832_01208-mRNA-1:cds n=1 Tax=Sporidiobolus salmonicolor TaxID=5005 RepID=A0A0D6EIX3_SPOSA|nr:SPOSA6832_01208 [Sporobolomyces salmonicolor]